MAARKLDPRSSMLALLPQCSFTLGRLKASPHGAPYVATFQTLRDDGVEVLNQEIQHVETMNDAQAVALVADGQADGFVSRLAKAVLTITGDNREDALYIHYFDGKTPSEIRRPVLGPELATLKKWVPSLTQSAHPALAAMAPELSAIITVADAAELGLTGARQQNRIFRDVGERRHWVDRLNAARKQLHGQLTKLTYEIPGLPSDYADRFFLSTPERDGEPETSEEIREQIEEMLAAVEAAQKRLAEVEAAEAAEAEAEEAAARAADAAALAKLEQEAAALEQKRAAIQARLGSARA